MKYVASTIESFNSKSSFRKFDTKMVNKKSDHINYFGEQNWVFKFEYQHLPQSRPSYYFLKYKPEREVYLIFFFSVQIFHKNLVVQQCGDDIIYFSFVSILQVGLSEIHIQMDMKKCNTSTDRNTSVYVT